MLDDGVGPAVYEELLTRYDIPDNVELFDLGCLSLNMIERVRGVRRYHHGGCS